MQILQVNHIRAMTLIIFNCDFYRSCTSAAIFHTWLSSEQELVSNQSDVLNVTDRLIESNFSTDVLWLDFASGNDLKYFEFNPVTFPDALLLQGYLYERDKRLVAAIEPFTKVDTNYTIYNEALARDYFVKNQYGTDFYMNYSGATVTFLDYFNPDARAYFASLYSFSVFNQSSPILHVWNDLNEPTIFGRDDIERTMPKDVRHYGGWLHRDVHNQFGFYETAASYQGLVDRLNGTQRAFVLTRAHFAGTQRYAAIWTGDNQAEWRYLEMVGPMCLSEAVAGINNMKHNTCLGRPCVCFLNTSSVRCYMWSRSSIV